MPLIPPAGRRSCPNRRFSFPTSLAGSAGGRPAMRHRGSSPTGRGACGEPRRYLPPTATSVTRCWPRALPRSRYICRMHLVARLSALSHGQGATLFMTLLAGFKTLLLARSGRNDICVATAMANRSQLRTERVIGPVGEHRAHPHPNSMPICRFRTHSGRVRDSVLETYARQELPFDVLAARLAEEEGLDPASLMQVFFVLQNAFRRPLKLPDVSVRPFAYPERAAGHADRSHLAQGVAQGDPGGHYRHMQLQGRVVRAGRSAALGRALQGDPGQGGRRPRDVARPVGRSLNMRSDDHASRQIRSALHGSAKLPANRPGFKEYSA